MIMFYSIKWKNDPCCCRHEPREHKPRWQHLQFQRWGHLRLGGQAALFTTLGIESVWPLPCGSRKWSCHCNWPGAKHQAKDCFLVLRSNEICFAGHQTCLGLLCSFLFVLFAWECLFYSSPNIVF